MNNNLKPQLMKTTDHWNTPEYLFKQLEEEFGKFNFDPCPSNSKNNALMEMDWKGNVFINPPYSNVEEFLNKGLLELRKGNVTQLVYLIIPRTSTKYWNRYVMNFADVIYFIPYRLKFSNCKSSAPFPSCIVVFKNLIKKEFIQCKTWSKDRI